MNPVRKYLYIGLGTLFLGLGALGIFLPLLPTTPFWLLTCWFYLRSSERLYQKAMRNKYFGAYMRAYMEDKSIPLRAKIITLVVMWISMACAAFFFVEALWIRLFLAAIGLGVTWHILSFPTRKE